MDKAATKEALSVKVNGKAIKGKVSFTRMPSSSPSNQRRRSVSGQG